MYSDLEKWGPSKGRWYLDFLELRSVFICFPCSDISHFHFFSYFHDNGTLWPQSVCHSARPRKPGRTTEDRERRMDSGQQIVMAICHVWVLVLRHMQVSVPVCASVVNKSNNNINSRHSQPVFLFLCAKTKAGAGLTQAQTERQPAPLRSPLILFSPWT